MSRGGRTARGQQQQQQQQVLKTQLTVVFKACGLRRRTGSGYDRALSPGSASSGLLRLGLSISLLRSGARIGDAGLNFFIFFIFLN